jgi:hypothetical protein
VILVDGTVINESLMLGHSGSKRDIIIFAPSTEGVEEEDGVLVALGNEVKSGLLEEEAMSVMEGVSDLEGEDGIGTHGIGFALDFLGSHSVLIHIVVPHDLSYEVHGLSRDEPFSLGHDVLSVRVGLLEASEGSGADLFLSVFEEFGFVNNGEVHSLVSEGNGFGSSESNLINVRDVLSDGDRHKVDLTVNGEGLLVHALEQFHLVHESLKRVSPSFSNSLDEFSLHGVNLKLGVSFSSRHSVSVDEGLNNSGGVVVLDASLSEHISLEDSHALIQVHLFGVDVKGILGLIVRSGDTGEVLHDTGSSFLVHSLSISLLALSERGADVNFNVVLTVSFVSSSNLSSGGFLRSDERAEDNLSSSVQKLSCFSNSSDVLGSIFGRESKTSVKSLSDDITIEAVDSLGVTGGGVKVLLHGFGESRFTTSGETGEEVSASLFDG